jgi:MoaA/NifB/PqqE/SkfB family radical SAM enzyme
MNISHIFQAWGGILVGRRPNLSLEVTRECPLRCPGCYAYEDNHLGGETNLRELNDFKGPALVAKILELVDRLKPLHLSIVGGDPLVRYREMEEVMPQLLDRGIHVQLVTSAFRTLPASWANRERLNVVVSIDGLPEDHDIRRAPATYERILKHIEGQSITVHCTLTGQMMKRPGYLEEFCEFWHPRADVKRLWFSMFTPQRGASAPEILTRRERQIAIDDLLALRGKFPKIGMNERWIREFASPPSKPDECIFALTTTNLSADFQTKISPCQLGGDPDCSQCGCIASMGLAVVGNHRLGGLIPVHRILHASTRVGELFARSSPSIPEPAFRILD